MDLSKTIQNLKDFTSDHKIEIACIGAITLAYQGYSFWKKKEEEVSSPMRKDSLMNGKIQERDEVIEKEEVEHVKLRRRVSIAHQVPQSIIGSANSLIDEVQHLYNPACKIQKVPHLILELELTNIPSIRSPLIADKKMRDFGAKGFLPEECFIYRGSCVLEKNIFKANEDLINPLSWLLAGPRKFLHFKPSQVKAAIVTCGGLCPGLNVVIRQIYSSLSNTYGCPEVWGVKYGYFGFYSGEEFWIRLTEKFIRELQYQGGTIFGSSRGGFDEKKIIDSVEERGINHLYIIGGDGTHRGILKLCEEIKRRKLEISIVGVPKTIDNDIPIIDKSFGFETAVAESIRAIRSAYVQSIGVNYGIGLVRLMGRDAGFIAMQATNASRDVNICLVPQFKFDLYGTFGVLEYIYEQLKIRKHLVIVVAEGAGAGVRDSEYFTKVELDPSGNKKLPDIGVFLKNEIVAYCKKQKLDATLKYIDPAYMIRTVPANAYDRKMCAHLAASAVHGAMAGFTAFTVGQINQQVAMIPITAINRPNRISHDNRAWQRLLTYTGQPTFLNEAALEKIEEKKESA